ncbi:MAG TPA: serine/threonine-protein kinase [Kofleriaceae bacterium]|nr:serine/threonine-protein kinase [Kofleriaceae bacterium]
MASSPSSGSDSTAAAGGATVTSGTPSSPLTGGATARDLDDHPAERDYELGAELGRGGMGRVLRARDRRLGREVAIKELFRTGVEARRRFEREARITALLQHPAIVPVYEVVTDGTTDPYYAMRLVEGATLSERIGAATPLERRALVRHVLTVAEAMAYAHGQRVIHRDLKASNVIVGELGETVVIDWGLAKRLSEDDESAPDAGPARFMVGSADVRPEDDLTVAGAIMGTPAYMPPEQANGDAIDARADVYAIGAMLYHTLAGAMPYSGRTSREILAEVVSGPPPPLTERLPDVPRDLAAIVARAMAREPADRYPSARELAADLARYLNGQLVASHRYAPRELFARWVRRHRAAVAVGAVAVVVAAVGGTIAVRNVIAARDRARADRTIAERERAKAVLARSDATARADDAILALARTELASDPRAALVRLETLSPGAPQWREARPLVADALARGVATTLGEVDDVTGGAVTGDGDAIVAGTGGLLVAVPDETGRLRLSAAAGQSLLGQVASRAAPGTVIAAVSLDGSARVWVDGGASAGGASAVGASAVGERLATITVGATKTSARVPAATRALAITPGGSTLIIVTDDDVRALDVSTGRERVLGPTPPGGGTWRAALSADRSFVLVERGPSARALRLDGGATGIPEELWDAATSADGRWLAYKTQGGLVVRDPAGKVRTIDPTGGGATLRFDPQGRWLAWCAPSSADVQLWDLRAWRGHTLRGHHDVVESIAFDRGGTRLASASSDGTVRVHELAWIDVLQEPFADEGPSSVVSSLDLGEGVVWVAFAQAGQLVAATRNGRVVRWPIPAVERAPLASAVLISPTLRWKAQLATGALVATPLHAAEPARRLTGVVSYWSILGGPRIVSFRPTPRWAAAAPVLVAAGEQSILRWDVERDTTDRLPLAVEPEALAISADGARVAALTTDGAVQTLAPDQPPRMLGRATAGSYLAFAPDGRHVAACGVEARVFAADGVPLDLPPGTACAFSPAADAVAIGGATALHLCTLADRRCTDLADSGGATAIRIAPTGRIVAQLGEGLIVTWDSATAPRRTLGRLRGGLDDLDLSRDGATLVTGSRGPELVLWDLATATSRTLRGPLRSIDEVWLEADNTVGVSDAFSVLRFPDSLPHTEAGLRAAIAAALR